MSLVRLLTTGKSLVGLRDSVSRYRVPRQRVLPKFEARSNPFAVVTRPGEGAAAPRTAPEVATELSEANKGTVMQERETGRARLLLSKLNVFSWFRSRRTKRSGQVVESLGDRPVQTELRLENVSVIRNDLMESDLEVIPGRTAEQQGTSGAGAKVSPASAPRLRSGGGAWNRVSARLFSAGRS